MKLLVPASWTAVVIALTIGPALASCGSGEKQAGVVSQTQSGAGTSDWPHGVVGAHKAAGKLTKDADGDYDSETRSRNDPDDAYVLDYGQAASAEDRQKVTAVVKRYYAATAAANGALVCSLTYWVVAETIAEEYGGAHGQDRSCASVASMLFRHLHRRYAADAASLQVMGVRVEGNRGLALLDFKRMPDRHIMVHREGDTWRIYVLFDSGFS